MKSVPFRVMTVLCAVLQIGTANAGELTVDYCGIQIIAPGNGGLRPFKASEDGVKVAFRVGSVKGGIVSMSAKTEVFCRGQRHSAGRLRGFGSTTIPVVSHSWQ